MNTANTESWQRQREPYEFSNSVKKYALERAGWKCEECGKSKKDAQYLEIHHIVPIWWAIKYPILAQIVIKSTANAQALCKECHTERHKERTEYFEETELLLSSYMRFICQA